MFSPTTLQAALWCSENAWPGIGKILLAYEAGCSQELGIVCSYKADKVEKGKRVRGIYGADPLANALPA
jgi:hypothetical protein